jgi:hypothetical protein
MLVQISMLVSLMISITSSTGLQKKGYIVDFSLTGFPIIGIDLNEDGTRKTDK